MLEFEELGKKQRIGKERQRGGVGGIEVRDEEEGKHQECEWN